MNHLAVDSVAYNGDVTLAKFTVIEHLTDFSYEFEFGKSYLLDSELGKGAWALCWLIGGKLKPDCGQILIDAVVSSVTDRLKLSWFIRMSERERFRGEHRLLEWHIRQGLKRDRGQYFKTEDELKQVFMLTDARYERKIRQFSSEGWRASCAIGMANGRKIFCFPSLVGPGNYLIAMYGDLWLKKIIDVMKESGALVLIPAQLDEFSDGLCDQVVNF